MKAFVVLILCLLIFGAAGYYGYQIFLVPQKEAKKEALQTGATSPGKPPPDPSLPEFQRCMKLRGEKKPVEARTALEAFIENNPNSTKLEEARTQIGEINTDIFFSATPSPDKEQYVIQKGDLLMKIAKKTKAPVELIMRTNNLADATKLQIGQILWVPHTDFSLVINSRDKKIVLMNGGKFFKQYNIKIWKAPASKSTAPIKGKVGEKIAYKNGQRAAFGSKEYAGSARWILLSIPGYTIYAENTAEAGGVNPPGNGIGVSPEDAEELASLLSKDVPVTVGG